MTLMQRTLELAAEAKARGITHKEMCDGIGVTVRWWMMVLSSDLKDPSVHKIQALHDWLERRLGKQAA